MLGKLQLMVVVHRDVQQICKCGMLASLWQTDFVACEFLPARSYYYTSADASLVGTCKSGLWLSSNSYLQHDSQECGAGSPQSKKRLGPRRKGRAEPNQRCFVRWRRTREFSMAVGIQFAPNVIRRQAIFRLQRTASFDARLSRKA